MFGPNKCSLGPLGVLGKINRGMGIKIAGPTENRGNPFVTEIELKYFFYIFFLVLEKNAYMMKSEN